MTRILWILLSSWLLSGCTATLPFVPVSAEDSFSPQSNKAMVILGLSAQRLGGAMNFTFYEHDKETGGFKQPADGGNRVADVKAFRIKWVSGQIFERDDPWFDENTAFAAVFVEPGDYALERFSLRDGDRTYIRCMNDRSIAFTVAPGEVLYLGLFDILRRSSPRYRRHARKPDARLFLKGFPKIDAEVAERNVRQFRFINGIKQSYFADLKCDLPE